MEGLSPKELIPYLKTAVELESSIYSQDEAIHAAQNALRDDRPTKRMPIEPAKRTPKKPMLEQASNNNGCACIFLSFFGLAFAFLGLSMIRSGGGGFVGILLLIVAGLCILGLIAILIKNSIKAKEINLKNAAAIAEYKLDKKNCEIEYQKAMQQYAIACENADKEYQHRLDQYEEAQKAISQMEESLSETEMALDKLYEIGWLYPKYHSFIAVCSIYEYFLTGRCAELTGPDGAYNLYESELRQNVIINSLETIADNLSRIRNNQYMLYEEMEKTEKMVEEIRSDIIDIYSETKSISNASYIAAARAEIAAKNSEALKYIALINAAK